MKRIIVAAALSCLCCRGEAVYKREMIIPPPSPAPAVARVAPVPENDAGTGDSGVGRIGLEHLATIARSFDGAEHPDVPPPGPRSSVKIDVLKSTAFTKEIPRRIIKRHTNEVRFCHERELASKPGLQGAVDVEFVIAASGAVMQAAVVRSTIDDDRIPACLEQAVRRWTFPMPHDGKPATVRVRFTIDVAAP